MFWKHGLFQHRLLMLQHPELEPMSGGYQAMTVRKALSVSQWLGQGNWNEATYELTVPDWNHDFLLTTVVYKLGWLPFLLLVLAVAGLLLWLLRKCLRQRNQAGRLVALSVILPLGLQVVFSVLLNLGYVLFSVSVPLVSGNLHMAVTMGLIGLTLSVFREDSVARMYGTAHQPVSWMKLSFQKEENVQNGSHVLGISLIISRNGTKAAEDSSLS